jgi:hypothetical protein
MTHQNVQATTLTQPARLFWGERGKGEAGSCMIRYFDYPWGVGEFPGWKGVGLGSDPPIPRHPSIKSRKSMGIHDPLRSNLSYRGEGKHIGLVVSTVEPYCSWTNAKRVWMKHRSYQDSTRSGHVRTSSGTEPGQKRGQIHATL